MIKMDYGDAHHQQQLEKDYIKIFANLQTMQQDWSSLRKRLIKREPNFKGKLPVKIQELLLKPYMELVEIYEIFDSLGIKGKARKTNKLYIDCKALFCYEAATDSNGIKHEKLQPNIADFFIAPNNFNIHTCHYCDMAYINHFVTSKGKRTQFDIEHVLDKGRCPLVALSLYNFVPICPTCNGPHIKGKRQMKINTAQRKKLSPTSPLYDFENKVKIHVHNINGKCTTFGFEKRMDEYEILFDTSLDPDYKEEIEFLFLEQRYNYHKCEALRLLDLKERYTNKYLIQLAHMIAGPSGNFTLNYQFLTAQLKEDIFSTNFMEKHHRAFGKMRKDILG